MRSAPDPTTTLHHLCPGKTLGSSTLQIYYITALNISDTVQFMITSAVCVIDYTESFLLAKYSMYNVTWFSVQCFESMSHKDGAQCNTSLAPLASSFICVNAGIRILTARDVKLHRLCMCEGVWMCESIYMLM